MLIIITLYHFLKLHFVFIKEASPLGRNVIAYTHSVPSYLVNLPEPLSYFIFPMPVSKSSYNLFIINLKVSPSLLVPIQ